MRYDRIFTKLFCDPLLADESFIFGLQLAALAVMRGEIPVTPPMVKKVDHERADAYAQQVLEIRGRTAVVHIDGAIDKNLSSLDRISFNATDLNDVDRALAAVKAKAQAGAIDNLMLACDSPGGSVPGTPETAARVRALSDIMNTAAYLQTGCSAMYWIASQCTEIYAPPSSSTGSIGVYCALLDQSERLAKMGVAVTAIQDGKLKTAGAPWKPLSKEEKASIQDRISQIGEMFRAAVTDVRPQIERDTMEGQSFLGPKALEVGLIDALVGDLDEAIAMAF